MLVFLSSAFAAVTCDEVRRMVQSNFPEAIILETIKEQGIYKSELACLEGLPPVIVSAAQTVATDPPIVTPPPNETLVPPSPIDLSIPHVAPREQADNITPCALQVMVRAPDPGAAATLSLGIGFGAGHFYAKKPTMGMIFLLPQAIGAGFVLAGAIESQPALIRLGSAVSGTFRLLDITLAPTSAHQTATEMLEECW